MPTVRLRAAAEYPPSSQKLFEAIAACVPVVAADLPGMACVVRAHDLGELCDPTSPASVAEGIRRVLAASPEERAATRARILRLAHDRYNWGAQLATLFGIYAELAPVPAGRAEASETVA